MGEPKFTPGKWNWWTSCSWKRLRSDLGGGKDVSVVEPFVSRSDGHPDLTVSDADMALIAAAPDLFGALIDILEYSGGAASALDDEYVVDRARAALLKASPGGTE